MTNLKESSPDYEIIKELAKEYRKRKKEVFKAFAKKEGIRQAVSNFTSFFEGQEKIRRESLQLAKEEWKE